ncbi:hypothetical protein [Allopontixanthobacter sp.]|uniref:hypothetical protein n=1 Tax=Allopontixanthobacter sp. TaxID=2906452 RepID=UPI002ABAFF7F|nr:hypothetical protein [Allopontixanthobacter sp.]MDZ4306981.1 hypothetical protein [Allopontixanthobacter sp.]
MSATRPEPRTPTSSGPHTIPLLDLDTLIERRKISIDGELYEILSPDELSVIESHRFGVWGKRIEQLADKEGEEEIKELEALIARASRKILVGVPDEVFARLPGAHQWAVIDLFTGLLLQMKLKVAGAMQTAMGELPEMFRAGIFPTGAQQSPVSSGSMADPPRPGWWTRLLRWSGPA